jgi:hypothetical protein
MKIDARGVPLVLRCRRRSIRDRRSPLDPATLQLVDEVRRRRRVDVDAGLAPEPDEEIRQCGVVGRVLAGDEVRALAEHESIARRRPEHEAPEPVRQMDAEDQQMPAPEFREEPLGWGNVTAHQAVDEFQGVLVVDRVVG